MRSFRSSIAASSRRINVYMIHCYIYVDLGNGSIDAIKFKINNNGTLLTLISLEEGAIRKRNIGILKLIEILRFRPRPNM